MAPQIVLLTTVALLVLTAKMRTGGPKSACAMICFTGMVVATLMQLRLYTLVFTAGRTTPVPSWVVLDPMAWVFAVAILLVATVCILIRRLRSYTGQGDLRFCLLITISTLAWSVLPALHSLPLIAGGMLLGSLPLALLSTFGSDKTWLTILALLTALAIMLVALAFLTLRGLGTSGVNEWIRPAHGSSVWTGILVVLFMMPILFWIGSLPLVWWFGEAAGDTPAPVAFFMLLVPYIASLGAYLRIIHSLNHGNPSAARVVMLTMLIVGILAVAAYGIRAAFQYIVPDIFGSIAGILAACTFVTIASGMSVTHVNGAELIGCVLLYALTSGLALGSAVGILGRRSLGLNQQWPSFARMKKLHALMLVLALLSLGGLPPTLGSVARIECLRTVGPESLPGLLVLIVNAMGILFGSGAALRVGAYALMDVPEMANASIQTSHDKRRRIRRMTTGTLLLFLTACVLNALALLAYYPIHQIAASFAPAWISR